MPSAHDHNDRVWDVFKKSFLIHRDESFRIHCLIRFNSIEEHKMPSGTDPATVHATQASPNFFSWGHTSGTTFRTPTLTQKFKGKIDKLLHRSTASHNFCLALLSNGQLWAWGESKHGCLGLGMDKTNSPDPALVTCNEPGWGPIQDVVGGRKHVLVLTRYGSVFSFGNNEAGQLGVADTASRLQPSLVNIEDAVKQVAALEDCSYAVSTKGDVYAWGDRESGLIPVDTHVPAVLSPLVMLNLLPHRIDRLEISEAGGEQKITAYVKRASGDEGDADEGGNLENESDALEDMAAANERQLNALYRGVELLKRVLQVGKEWHDRVSQMGHAMPYAELLGPTDPLQSAEHHISSYQFDEMSSLDSLMKFGNYLDQLIRRGQNQLDAIVSVESMQSSTFVLTILLELFRLKREKVTRLISCRNLLAKKKQWEGVMNNTKRETMGACSQAIDVMMEVLGSLRQTTTIIDVPMQQLQTACMEALDVKIQVLELEKQILENAANKEYDSFAVQSVAVRRAQQAFEDLRSFSVLKLYEECDRRHFDFGKDADFFQHLLRVSSDKIDGIVQQFSSSAMLTGHDPLLPRFLGEMLLENAELRKMAAVYQFKVLVLCGSSLGSVLNGGGKELGTLAS